jgi:hypothetical protein
MKSYTYRVVVDTKEDSFRDIEIASNATFESLHNAIIEAYEFRGDQMTSFFMSDDDWEKGEEISLMDMGFGKSMSDTKLDEMMEADGQKILYVYDFLKLWVFYVELVKTNAVATRSDLPAIILKIGKSPNEDDKEIPNLLEGMTDFDGSSSKSNEVEDFYKTYGDEFNDDLDDDFEGFENIDDLDI